MNVVESFKVSSVFAFVALARSCIDLLTYSNSCSLPLNFIVFFKAIMAVWVSIASDIQPLKPLPTALTALEPICLNTPTAISLRPLKRDFMPLISLFTPLVSILASMSQEPELIASSTCFISLSSLLACVSAVPKSLVSCSHFF